MEDLGVKRYKIKKAPKGWKQDKRTERELLGNQVEEPKKKRKLRLAPISAPSLSDGQDLKKATPTEKKTKVNLKMNKKTNTDSPLEKLRKSNNQLGQDLLKRERRRSRGE